MKSVELQTTETPTASVIWLHGLGADGYDFVPMVKELEALGAPPARYVFPHAPEIPVTINNGFVMRAWYDIVGADLARQEDGLRIRASATAVEGLIEREAGRGIARCRVVLAGFSQGGAITLHAGIRQSAPLAGLIALSTYLPLAHTADAERSSASQRVPILMAHGSGDQVVPLARGAASRDTLRALGFDVRWSEYPMSHSVCEEEIRSIAAFLKEVLA